MCGIVGQARSRRRPGQPAAARADVRRPRAPRARTRAGIFASDGVGLGIQRLRVIDLDDRRPADLQRGRLGRRRPQRRDLQLPRAARRPRAGRATASPPRATRRRSCTSTRSTGRLRRAPARHVRVRALGPPPPAPAARARPPRQEAALLRPARRHALVRLRDGRAARATRRSRARSTTRRSTRYLTYGYVPAPRSALRAAEAPACAHARLGGRQRRDRALLAARLLAQARAECRGRSCASRSARRSCAPPRECGWSPTCRSARSSRAGSTPRRSSPRWPRPRRSPSRRSRSASTRGVRRAAARTRGSRSCTGPSTTSSSCEPNAIEILPQLVRHYGEPFADSSAIPSFYLAELTRRHVTVALNGDGGDEAFGATPATSPTRCRAARPPAGARCGASWPPPAGGCPSAARSPARSTARAGWPARWR